MCGGNRGGGWDSCGGKSRDESSFQTCAGVAGMLQPQFTKAQGLSWASCGIYLELLSEQGADSGLAS